MPLLHDAINAYLSPLLKKHSVEGVLSMEDLNQAMEASKAVLAESPNEFVMVSEFFCIFLLEPVTTFMIFNRFFLLFSSPIL
jgi:hypothetical protein